MDEHVGTMDEFIGPLVKEAAANKNKSKSRRSEEVENGVKEGCEALLGHLINSTDGTFPHSTVSLFSTRSSLVWFG